MHRPALPFRYANPRVKETLDSGSLPPVKYQILNCQGKDILVGRLKIETPTSSGHAFILRRFDTGAISLTTMFRAAFPNAPDQDEKDEVRYVKDTYDLTGNNGTERDPSITRLAGTWVDTSVALELGRAYQLGDLIHAVVDAQPDPKANYRRSAKAPPSTAQPTPRPPSSVSPAQPAVKFLPTSSPAAIAPTPSKRRKESSPAPSEPSAKSPQPRRSARTKSPPPKSASMQSIASVTQKTPTKSRSRRKDTVTPGGSDETAVEEDAEVEDVAGDDLHEQDIAEQKALIADLKKKKAATAKPTSKAASKRIRQEEEKLKFDFKGPAQVSGREIATNRRVGMEPKNKAAVWGVAAFVFGAGAVAFLPNLL